MELSWVEPQMEDVFADSMGMYCFYQACLRKLAKKRQEGRGGWNKPEAVSIEQLQDMLLDHVTKGDMVDVGNIAMMIWNRQRMEDTADGEELVEAAG